MAERSSPGDRPRSFGDAGLADLEAGRVYDGEKVFFLPIHVYEVTTGKPVAVILRPGKTPDGAEVALVLRQCRQGHPPPRATGNTQRVYTLGSRGLKGS